VRHDSRALAALDRAEHVGTPDLGQGTEGWEWRTSPSSVSSLGALGSCSSASRRSGPFRSGGTGSSRSPSASVASPASSTRASRLGCLPHSGSACPARGGPLLFVGDRSRRPGTDQPARDVSRSCPVPALSLDPPDGAASQSIHTGNYSDTIEPTGRLRSVVWRDPSSSCTQNSAATPRFCVREAGHSGRHKYRPLGFAELVN
jgi:hypothetical protein